MFLSDVIVIGGGIVGASIAAALAESGAGVTLLETGVFAGAGASGYSGGIVRLYDPDPAMLALGAHAIRCRGSSRAGRAFDASIRKTGVLYRLRAEDAHAVDKLMYPFRERDYPSAFLDGTDLAVLGTLAGDRAGTANLYEPLGGFGDVRFATQSLIRLVRHFGVALEHAQVAGLQTDERGGVEVRLTDGTGFGAQIVVLAMGGWTRSLAPDLALDARSIPLARINAGRPVTMPVVDAQAGCYAVPLGGTIAGVGCGLREIADQPEALPPPSAAHARDGLRQLSRLTGHREDGPVLGVLSGFDSYSPDGRPVIGFLDESPVYVAAGMCGIGFKVAPAVADLAASQIQARLRRGEPRDPELMAAFAPGRFAQPGAAATRRAQ